MRHPMLSVLVAFVVFTALGGPVAAGSTVTVDSRYQSSLSDWTVGDWLDLTAGDYVITVVDNPNDYFDAYKRGAQFDWRWEINYTAPGIFNKEFDPTGLEYPTQQDALNATLGMQDTFSLPTDSLVYFWLSDHVWDDNVGGMTLTVVPEPSAFGLLALGGLLVTRRRR